MSKTLVVLREAAAGAATACVALPLSAAAGVLVYSQFGAEFLAIGAIAGLITVVVGGALASLFYDSLSARTPQLGQAVVKTIARELAERLRITSTELQHADR